MWNRWVLFICFGIIALSVVSYSYASDETDILNNTVNSVSVNASSVDLESDNYGEDSFDDVKSDIDNITIYHGEQIYINCDFELYSYPPCSCTVFIDNKLVNFTSYSESRINMYNYEVYEDFLNSIFPNVGLHNMSIIFEFDTPQKYDVTLNQYKYEDWQIYNDLRFQFNINENLEAKKRYSYNTTLNILKKDKTVHIGNLSSPVTYNHLLSYDVSVDNSGSLTRILISSTGDIIDFDPSADNHCVYDFKNLMQEIKPGVYNLTVVNTYDNTFDTASFLLCNDISINTTYKIKGNDVIFNVELWCEYNTTIEFDMYGLINETEYWGLTKEIIVNGNNYKFNFEIYFNNVGNNDYYVDIFSDGYLLDKIYLTVNYTFVNETDVIEDISDVNKTDVIEDVNDLNKTENVSDIIEKNVLNVYNSNNTDGNAIKRNGTGDNLNLKGNSTNSNSHKSNVHNDDFKEVISGFGDLASSVDSVSSENANSYELIEKSTSKSADNIFSNLGIIILLFIAFMVGFLRFKREN